MSIVRAKRPDSGFTIVDNNVIRDQRLSWRARGLLIGILSRPDDWRTDSTQLAREGKEGREAVRTALRELESCGYVVRTKERAEGGKWVTLTMVYDTPQDIPAGHTEDGFPGAGSPGAGKLGAVRSTETKNHDEVGSDERSVGLPAGSTAPRPTERKLPRKPTAAQQDRMNADYVDLRALCTEQGQDDPYSVWWTLRLEHKATAPSRFMADLIDRGQWEGFVGSHGITEYERPERSA